jgi:deoxycytidylate deaminase
MTRPSWEEYALLLANTASLRSEDPYIKCGACVLRHDNSVAALGYNGSISGYDIDWSDRDKRRPFVSHAERSALRYCKPGEAKLIAVTLSPCQSCIIDIAMFGIKKVIYQDVYQDYFQASEIAKRYDIELIQL